MVLTGLESIEEIIEHIKNKFAGGRVGWHGQRCLDCLCIDHLINVDFIISCDHGMDAIMLESEKKIFSIEKDEPIRKKWGNDSMNSALSGKIKEPFERYMSEFENINYLFCYRSTEAIEKIEKEAGNLVNLSMPREIKSFFDDKIRLRETLSVLNLPVIPGLTVNAKDMNYNEIKDIFGDMFILQSPVGSSGNASHVITDEEGYEEIIKKKGTEPVVITKFIDGISLNVNACVCNTEKGVSIVCTYPSAQIIGARGCCQGALDYCGNDYSTELSENDLKIIFSAVEKIGHFMSEFGWKGIFGLDLLWHEKKPYIIDLNPRFQGSTQILTDIQRTMGLIPLTLLHMLEFIEGAVPEKLVRRARKEAFSPLTGSQLIIHAMGDVSEKIIQELPPGVYKTSEKRLLFLRDGFTLSDSETSSDEFVLTSGNPFKGMEVYPGSSLMKMHTWKKATDEKNGINQWASEITEKIYLILFNDGVIDYGN